MKVFSPRVATDSVFAIVSDYNVMRVSKVTLSTGVVSAERDFYYYA